MIYNQRKKSKISKKKQKLLKNIIGINIKILRNRILYFTKNNRRNGKKSFHRRCMWLDFHCINFMDNIMQGTIFIPQGTFCSASENHKIYICWWMCF